MEKIDLKGSLTEQNLLKAFAGESQAAARYRMYAKQARKDGFEKVACFFDETVHNELRHGKIYFEFLQGGMVEITASYPAGVIGTTLENLDEAAQGEYDEWQNLYPAYSEVAKQEGDRETVRYDRRDRAHAHGTVSRPVRHDEGRAHFRQGGRHRLALHGMRAHIYR